MRKMVYAALSIFLLLSGCQSAAVEDTTREDVPTSNFTAEMTDEVWNSANMEYGRLQSKAEFIAETDAYIAEISSFLGRENWFDVYKAKHGEDYVCGIEYLLTDSASHVEGGYSAHLYLIPSVYLMKSLFEHDLAPIAHETTHIIVPFYSSLSLREGLAAYCQDKFGKNPSMQNWGQDVHAFAHLFIVDSNAREYFDRIFPVIGTANATQANYTKGGNREYFYNLSYSFVKYLIDSYGIEKFMQLYESEDLINDYEIIYGKPIDEVKNDWREYLEDYPDAITLDELKGLVAEVFDAHNFSAQ